MRRRRPYDWTGERVLRRQKRMRIVKLTALMIAIGILGIAGALVVGGYDKISGAFGNA